MSISYKDTDAIANALGGALNDGAFDLSAALDRVAKAHNIWRDDVHTIAKAVLVLAEVGVNGFDVVIDLANSYRAERGAA